MPPFMPNDKMLEIHKDKGDQDWEIYAWCVRDAIAKASGLPKSDGSLREKREFESLYNGKKAAIEIDGVKYTRSMFGNPFAEGIRVEEPKDHEIEKVLDEESVTVKVE